MSEYAATSSFKSVQASTEVDPIRTTEPIAPRRASPPRSASAPVDTSPARLSAVQLFADAVGAGISGPADVHSIAAAGMRGAGGSLPHAAAIQRSFGHHDVSEVRAHVGGAAAEASAAIGARAYASGDQVAFASAPDLHLAAHETAHVVQQRAGVRLAGGVGAAGDAYEQHADSVADLVVQGKSAESLLDTMAHRGAAGGSAVQCDVSILDPFTAEMQLRVVIGRATAEEVPVIEAALDRATHERAPVVAAGHPPAVHVVFEMRGEHFSLWVPRDQIPSMRGALGRAAIMGTAEPLCEGGAVPHLSVTEPGPSLSRVLGEGIGAVAGPVGTEQQLTVDLNFPVGGSGGVFSAHLEVRVAHEAAHGAEPGGFVAEGLFEVGGGYRLPDVIRARVMAGIAIEAHGRDPQHTGMLLAFSLQNALQQLGATDLAEIVFGTGHARGPAMIEGESADAAGAIHGELEVGHVEDGHGAAVGLSLGLSEHAHVEGRAEGGPEATTYSMLDLETTIEIGIVSAALEIHAPTRPGAAEPEIGVRLSVHTELAGAAVLIASALQSALSMILAAVSHDSAAPDAAVRVRNGITAANAIVTAVEGSLASLPHEGEAGLELELELGGSHPQWILRMSNTREAEVAGQEIEYERLVELTRGPIGGARHVGHSSTSAPLVCAPEPT